MTAISGLLQTIPLLSALTPQQLDAVASICVRTTYETAQAVVTSGDQADAAYFLMDGQVDCLTMVDGKLCSTPIPQGATLLELAMIVELDVSATCTARGPAKVLRIPRKELHDLMQEDLALTNTIVETLTIRLKEMADSMRQASAPFGDIEGGFAEDLKHSA